MVSDQPMFAVIRSYIFSLRIEMKGTDAYKAIWTYFTLQAIILF